MIIVPPIPFIRRRKAPRSPGAAPPPPPPPPPPPAAITVISVVKGAGNDLAWTFSAPVTLDGGNVPELENDVDGTGMWQSPMSCAQGAAADEIIATYADLPGEATPWRIASEPSGIEQGASITVPQGGVIA